MNRHSYERRKTKNDNIRVTGADTQGIECAQLVSRSHVVVWRGDMVSCRGSCVLHGEKKKRY